MKIDSSQAQIQDASSKTFEALQQAQQTSQDMANKMIRLSIEQKVAGQKEQLTDHLVDILV